MAHCASALPVARLRNVKPLVQVRSPGADAFVTVREKSALRFGDIVRTDAKGKADLLFSNGTRVTMREKSQVQIVAPEKKDSPLVIRVFGALSEVFVRPKGNTQVKTAAAIAAARGTAFLVRLPDENTAVVTVTEDEVDFWNAQGQVLVAAGQESKATVGAAPTRPVAVDVSGALSWTAEIAGLPLEYEQFFITPNQSEARRALARSEGAAPSTLPARLEYGRALYDAGEYSLAVEQFKTAADAVPSDAKIWIALGQAQRAQGDLSAATTSYQRALQLDPQSTMAHAGLALVHLSQNDAESTVAARAALQPIAATEQARIILALLELRTGNSDEAEKLLQNILNARDDFYPAHALMALVELTKNRLNGAREHAQRAVQLQPNSAQAQGTLGLVLFFSGSEYSDEAERAASKAITLNPFSPFAMLVQGRVALVRGDTDEARENFGQAAALSPSLEITHTELGTAYLRQGKLASAEKEFRRALEINTKSSRAQSGLAQVLAARGKSEEAQHAFAQAIALSPEDASTHADYAAFLIAEGKLDEARIELEKSIIHSPDRGILFARLSEVSLLQQQVKAAERYALKAVSLLPDSALAHYQLGRVYMELERYLQAQQEFRIAVRFDREFAEARYALGYVREIVETGRDPSRPAAAAGAGALSSAARALNLQNLQSPGAEDRIQAALQDPTVIRSATRSYGDTELRAVAGVAMEPDGVLNGAASHLNLSDDRHTVIGATAQRESRDEVRDRENSDFTNDRWGIVFGRKAENSRSGILLQGDYERLKEGRNVGDQPPTSVTSRDEITKPRIIIGGNWQQNDRSRTRAMLQYSRPESRFVNPAFGDRQATDVDSVNAEVRHDHRFGRDHTLSVGAYSGQRKADVNLLLAGFPPFIPDFRFITDVDDRQSGIYVRDEFEPSKSFSLIGEAKLDKLKINSSSRLVEPFVTAPLVTKIDRTEFLPSAIAEYRPTSRTNLRLRARRVAGGNRDFQLLSPHDTFLSLLNDLPDLSATGRGSSLEFEMNHTLQSGSFLWLGAFSQQLKDVRIPTPDGAGPIIARSRLHGLRAGYEGSLTGSLSFFLTGSYTSARDSDADVQIANIPKFSGSSGIQFLNDEGWFLQPVLYYQSHYRRLSGGDAPSFTILNVRAGKRFGLRRVVFVEILNLTDEEYDILEVVQTGRQLRLGVNTRF